MNGYWLDLHIWTPLNIWLIVLISFSFSRTQEHIKGTDNAGRPNKDQHKPRHGGREKFRNSTDKWEIDYVCKDENGSLESLSLFSTLWQAAENINAQEQQHGQEAYVDGTGDFEGLVIGSDDGD